MELTGLKKNHGFQIKFLLIYVTQIPNKIQRGFLLIVLKIVSRIHNIKGKLRF